MNSKGSRDPLHIWDAALRVTRWVGSPISLVVHTIIFIGCFLAVLFDFITWNEMLLFLTTIVSLEAIYLSIFIQMTINYTTHELLEVGEDIEELQEDVGEIQEDVSEMQEDVGEIQEDVEELSEDVEEMSGDEKEEAADEVVEEARKQEQRKTLTDIQTDLRRLMQDIAKLQQPKQ